MAHTVDVTKLNDGARNAIFHVFLKCDGVTGEIVDEIVIDPAMLMPELKPVPSFTIDELWWDVSGFGVRLEFNSIPDTPAWTVSPGTNHICFDSIGGLADRSGLDGSGALQISTFGFDSAVKQGSLIIKIRK